MGMWMPWTGKLAGRDGHERCSMVDQSSCNPLTAVASTAEPILLESTSWMVPRHPPLPRSLRQTFARVEKTMWNDEGSVIPPRPAPATARRPRRRPVWLEQTGRFGLTLAFLAVVASPALGCYCGDIDCAPCRDAVNITAVDLQGLPALGLQAPGAYCSENRCRLGSNPGRYEIGLTAPGFIPKVVVVDVSPGPEGNDSCCAPCRTESVSLTVEMERTAP
jgi:hypothetical protein